MLFKSTFVLWLAALAAADVAAPANEARSVDTAAAGRMLRIKRAQDSIVADSATMAKRSSGSPSSLNQNQRRSGANRMDKRHHGDAGAHEQMAKRSADAVKRDELPLFQGLLSLLHKTSPGLNTVVLGTEGTLNGVVSGLDDVLKKRETSAPVNEDLAKRDELPLFQGLLSLLLKTYPGLNTVVLGTEGTLNGAVSGLDDVLKKRSPDEPLFQGLLSLLNKVYPGLNTVVLGTEGTVNGAVSGLDDVLKKRSPDEPLFQGLLSLLNKAYPGLNTAVLGTEGAVNGAVSGLDDVLKKRATTATNTQTASGDASSSTTVTTDDIPDNTADIKVNLNNVLNNLLDGGSISAVPADQLNQLRGLLSLLDTAGLNNFLGSSFSAGQINTVSNILGVNNLIGGLFGGLLGGNTGGDGNLLGGLLGGLGRL
ncbi:hypothetical protein JCM10213_000074 [Rhodosporidiobolus nylandii]